MTDIGSAVGGLAFISLIGYVLVSASLVFVGIQIKNSSKNRE